MLCTCMSEKMIMWNGYERTRKSLFLVLDHDALGFFWTSVMNSSIATGQAPNGSYQSRVELCVALSRKISVWSQRSLVIGRSGLSFTNLNHMSNHGRFVRGHSRPPFPEENSSRHWSTATSTGRFREGGMREMLNVLR